MRNSSTKVEIFSILMVRMETFAVLGLVLWEKFWAKKRDQNFVSRPEGNSNPHDNVHPENPKGPSKVSSFSSFGFKIFYQVFSLLLTVAVQLFCGESIYAYNRAKLGANQVGIKEQFEKHCRGIKNQNAFENWPNKSWADYCTDFFVISSLSLMPIV